MSRVIVKGVQKTLGNLLTLREIDLEVEERTMVGILGPSGCGKSTLLNIIAGLIYPDKGKVYINGQDVTGVTGKVSYMQQKDLLLPSRTLLDNVSIPLILKGMPKHQARNEAKKHLDSFGLSGFENYYPRQLSGGMRQRAALLRTYLFSSHVLLLDEPFASLDALTRRRMQSWLMEVFDHMKATALFVTHDVDEALHLCDKIYVLSECPAVVKLSVEIPFCRPHSRRTLITPEYAAVRDSLLEALSV